MPNALEQLRQGIGGIKPTSALDLLRKGITEPKEQVDLGLDFFRTQISTPAFMPPKPLQPSVGIKDVLREVPGVICRAKKTIFETIAPSKEHILSQIQEAEQITLAPEEAKRRVLERIGEEAVFAPNLFAVIQKAK